MLQWLDNELEYSGYASSGIVSSIRRIVVSVNMANNDDNDTDLHRCMQAQEEAI